MKIQKFEITIAVPQDIEKIDIEKIVEFLRGNIEELGFCAIEGKEVEK